MAAAALAPRLLSPLPVAELQGALSTAGLRYVFVPEGNYLGQLAELLKGRLFDTFRARPAVELHQISSYGGLPFTAAEIVTAVQRVLQPAAITG